MDLTLLANQFLDAYGLLAVFNIMLLKELGVPIPIPGDLIMLAAATRTSTFDARAAVCSISASGLAMPSSVQLQTRH